MTEEGQDEWVDSINRIRQEQHWLKGILPMDMRLAEGGPSANGCKTLTNLMQNIFIPTLVNHVIPELYKPKKPLTHYLLFGILTIFTVVLDLITFPIRILTIPLCLFNHFITAH